MESCFSYWKTVTSGVPGCNYAGENIEIHHNVTEREGL